MTEHLFVYGTLAPGRPNAHVLADVAGTWTPATVRGHLRAQGWGAAEGFPGIVPDGSGALVEGLVFSSPELAVHWQRLDAFEGDEYVRVLITATLEGGALVQAWVDALRPTPA